MKRLEFFRGGSFSSTNELDSSLVLRACVSGCEIICGVIGFAGASSCCGAVGNGVDLGAAGKHIPKAGNARLWLLQLP